jgi:hypothetical protein
LLVNCFGDAAVLSLVHVEYALIDTAGGIAIDVAMAVVNGLLQNTSVPTVQKVSMISIASWITIGVHKWL